MRSLLSLAAVLSVATLLPAQFSLQTTFAGGNGQSGNMFDIGAINPVIITGFDINLTGTADIEIYTLTNSNTPYLPSINTPGDWTLAGSAAGVVGAGAGVPTTVPIALAVPINAGEIQAFYVTTTNGTLAYTNGSTTGALFVSNADIEFFEGSGVAYPFTANFNPRIFNGNINYSLGSGTAATNQAYGAGCGGSAVGDGTFYEVFDAANPVDIANSSFTLVWGGQGYVWINGASGFYTPTSANLGLSDDGVVTLPLPFGLPTPQGVLNEVYLGSNGYLGFQSGLPGDFTETVAELLAQQTRLCFFWDDLEPNVATASVTAESDLSGTFHITFTDVPEWGTTNLNTFQVSLSPNGDIELKYGAIGSSTGLVGFSTGNGATDPGASDLTTVAPLVVATGVFVPDLALAGTTRPVIGTNWDLTTTGIDAVSPIAITYFGISGPAVSLPSIGIDAPGCDANMSSLFNYLDGANVGGSLTVSTAVPNDPTLVGAVLAAQSVCLTLNNPANILSSNGVEGTVGDV